MGEKVVMEAFGNGLRLSSIRLMDSYPQNYILGTYPGLKNADVTDFFGVYKVFYGLFRWETSSSGKCSALIVLSSGC